MAYPDRYFGFVPTQIAGTQNIANALAFNARFNDMFAAMTMAYGGEVAERYYAPPTPHGPWTRQFRYNLAGFDHTHTNADSDREFDRIIMQSGNFRFAWNFDWLWVPAPTSMVHLSRSFWYISPFPGEPYRYLGRHFYSHAGNVLSSIEWSDQVADPFPPPT